MTSENQDRRTMFLMTLLAMWGAAYAYSIWFLITTPAELGGITGGLSRLSGFVGWQAIAGLIGFAVWGIGWSFPKGSGVRNISGLPLILALAVVIVGIGMLALGGDAATGSG